MKKKITHEQARQHLENKIKDGNILTVLEYIKQQEGLEQHQKHSFVNELSGILYDLKQTEKLLELYKEFFDKLNIQLRNTFDIDYIYPHEFIIGYDIKSEDKELVKLFKQIKELEND